MRKFSKLIQAILGVFYRDWRWDLSHRKFESCNSGLMTRLQRVTNFYRMGTVLLNLQCLQQVGGGEELLVGTILFAFGIGPCLAFSLKILVQVNHK